MKILFASDSFKGSLTSEEIGQLLTPAVSEIFPHAETHTLCVADGGMGAMQALRVSFLDKNGQEVLGCGENLAFVDHIDISGLHPAAAQTRFTVMCDVTNPLPGAHGATYTFGRQKGADDAMLA